ncbi:hypothetical protein SUGI_0710880 [Cryptomeria japonica]|uniref:acyltransferase GLAUCE n=1 Tax=Cryptomeria japonica TaxID=3369 RepID=UPI0024147988|nr:acyltransferase GLAUCE [Cryptomeria japonica]GLJ35339.1 hypothetical protein SUGI_0710880 [Cryptomeria japonica]
MEPPAVSLVSDIGVKRKSLAVIRPEKRRKRYSLFLSNFDQKFVGYVTTFVHMFSGNQEIDFDAIIYLHTEALRRMLDFYDFISGRLTLNTEQRRFEIDCNAAGVPLAICASELTLEEMGDVTYPNSAFTQLCLMPESTNQISEEDHLMSFQVTRFRCGGFAVGTAVNHCLVDGFALHEFASNFAHLIRKGDVAFLPVIDRTCLKARVPLQIKYEHEELMKPSQLGSDSSPFMQRNLDLVPNKMALEKHVFKLFSLSGKMLDLLKLKAKEGGVSHCTSFIVALAHLWRTRTAAMANINANDITIVQYFVDIRSKMRPPLPREYVGNAIKAAYAKATAKELQEQQFYETVKKLEEAGNRLTDEYLRSTIDWLELHDGVMRLENGFLATSLTHMEYEDIQIVKGVKSIYAGPVISGTVDLVVFMADPKDKAGIKIFIALEPSNMARFQLLFKDVDSDRAVRSNL